MARDWALIEFRPGRYAKISPGGDFLGMATEAEVRAWFGAGEGARKPSPYRATAHPTTRQTEPSPSDESPALGPKPVARPEEPERTLAPSTPVPSQPPPAATSPRAEPKPLPPFLEHLRGASAPIQPKAAEPPATQEPKLLPPFLLRKLGQDRPPDAPAPPETLADSPAIAADTPPDLAPPPLIEKRAEGHPPPEQPAPQEPTPQESPFGAEEEPLDLLDLDEDPEETEPDEAPIQPPLLPEEADEDEPDEEDPETEEEKGGDEPFLLFPGLPSPTGRARPAVASAPPSAETPSQDSAGRWLWLDPRQDARHNPMAFDLAAFLQRAIALFQSKDWTGGQKPGRLAIHPDQMADGLSALADSLGLEIECDPLVNPGTYRLGLPRDKTR